jgi:molybdenum cofactor biosynthesis protein B
MSVTVHRASGPGCVSCAIVTVSDTRTPETDTSGSAIASLLETAGHQVASRALVKDDVDAVTRAVADALDAGPVDAVILTGGTGLSARDSTYEAVTGLFEKTIDGFGELFRALSFQEIGPAAMLSRATAGIARGRVIFLLPGSEAAVRLAMDRLIIPEVSHIVGELRRTT